MHDACLHLQWASDSSEARRFGQHSVAVKHRRPQHHIDEARLISQREKYHPFRCARALAGLQSAHERELGMIDAEIAYVERVRNS